MSNTIRRFFITGVLALIGAIAGHHHANAQVNPFNPDYAFCNTQGALAVRGPATWQCLLPGANGQVMVSGGPGAQPAWITATGSGTVTSVGATVPAFMTVGGSPITAAGTLAFSFNSQAQRLFLASPSGASGAPSFRALAAVDLPSAGAFAGDVSGTFPTASIKSGAVTNAKLANMPTLTLKSNVSGGAGAPSDNTLSAILDASYLNTQGALLYRGATGWTAIAAGTNGQMLTSGGPGANPSWTAVTGNLGGTVTQVTCGAGLTGGNINVTGTCAIDAGNVPGIATNAAASTGIVGQVISASRAVASGVGYPSGTPVNVANIVITPGDWDVSAIGYAAAYPAAAGLTDLQCSISDTSLTPDPAPGRFNFIKLPTMINGNGDILASAAIPPYVYRVSSNTTLYLVCTAYGVNDLVSAGYIKARRMR